MTPVKQLFYYQTEKITIDIKLGFNNYDSLVLEGYDIGKTVSELRGSTDYEYFISVKAPDWEKLYPLNGIAQGHREQLLEALATKINGNRSYTLFQEYLKENDIPYDIFTH